MTVTDIRPRREPCTNCGGDVEEVWVQLTGLRAGLPPRPPALADYRHAGDSRSDPVDKKCTRGQYGPTADYGEG